MDGWPYTVLLLRFPFIYSADSVWEVWGKKSGTTPSLPSYWFSKRWEARRHLQSWFRVMVTSHNNHKCSTREGYFKLHWNLDLLEKKNKRQFFKGVNSCKLRVLEDKIVEDWVYYLWNDRIQYTAEALQPLITSKWNLIDSPV